MFKRGPIRLQQPKPLRSIFYVVFSDGIREVYLFCRYCITFFGSRPDNEGKNKANPNHMAK